MNHSSAEKITMCQIEGRPMSFSAKAGMLDVGYARTNHKFQTWWCEISMYGMKRSFVVSVKPFEFENDNILLALDRVQKSMQEAADEMYAERCKIINEELV